MGAAEFTILVGWVICGILVAAGLSMLGPKPEDFRRARICFVGSGLLFAATGVMWGIETPSELWVRWVVLGAVGAIALVGTSEGLRFVSSREGPAPSQAVNGDATALIEHLRSEGAANQRAADEAGNQAAVEEANREAKRIAGLPDAKLDAELRQWDQPPAKDGRIFVPTNLTAERLLSFYENSTALQGDVLTKPYIGMWMPLAGTVGNVSSMGSKIQVSFKQKGVFERETWFDQANIYCSFTSAWTDPLRIVKPGDKISVIGKIEDVGSVTLNLSECELVTHPKPN